MSAEDYMHLDAIGEVGRQHESFPGGYTLGEWIASMPVEPLVEGSDEWKEYILNFCEETPMQRYMRKNGR